MKGKEFDLNIEGRTFHFELDEQGYVWLITENERIGREGTNVGQLRPVTDINSAREIAKLMLYSRRLIKKVE